MLRFHATALLQAEHDLLQLQELAAGPLLLAGAGAGAGDGEGHTGAAHPSHRNELCTPALPLPKPGYTATGSCACTATGLSGGVATGVAGCGQWDAASGNDTFWWVLLLWQRLA